jgi:hypothetical protein
MTDKNPDNASEKKKETADDSQGSVSENNVKELYGSLSELTKNDMSKPTPDWLPNAGSLISDNSGGNMLNPVNNDHSNDGPLGKLNGPKSDAGKNDDTSDKVVGPKIGEGDTRSPEQRRAEDVKKAADILGKRGDLGNKYQREQIEQMYKRAYNEGGQEGVKKLTAEINAELEKREKAEGRGQGPRLESNTKSVLKAGGGKLRFDDEVSLSVTQDGEKTDESTIDMSKNDEDPDDDLRRWRRHLDKGSS